MTEKLYYSDSKLFEFSARIIATEAYGKSYAVILDKTAFFPEGGGQQSDTGYIENYPVVDVQEVNGSILHILKCDCLPSLGEEVFCRIDAEKRFYRMQSHSGEHIVSGIAHSLYGAENVGFHMDDTLMTVDFDIPLTKEQLIVIEEKANECVYRNLPVKAFIVSTEEAAQFSYRSKLEFTDDVRLVEIENIDLCACCAPHVSYTGEIGIIKILTCVSHRGGVRITLICGKTALDDYIMKHNSTMDIASQLCSKHNETASAVKKLTESNSSQKYGFSVKQKILLEIIADRIRDDSIIVEFFNNLSMDDLRELCNFTKNKCSLMCIMLSGDDNNGYSYCAFSESQHLSSIIKCFNEECNGSGGGRGNMLQGKAKAERALIEKFFAELEIK